MTNNNSHEDEHKDHHENHNQDTQQDISANQIDTSFNYVLSVTNTISDASYVICADDLSNNPFITGVFDVSSGHIGNTVIGDGYTITTSEWIDASDANIENIVFSTTTDASGIQIYENLTEKVTTYDDEINSQTEILLNQIQDYANQIQCTNFHSKGSIDDYTSLFEAAGKIVTESKQMELNVDIEGFNDFASAADDLSELFSGFILKLQSVNIITDITFLTSISNALAKIVNLSNVFGKFKQAIFDTATIQIPKSTHDTKVILEDVMSQINCAMKYVNYFVDPSTDTSLQHAALSDKDKNIISQSVQTIENWNSLCEHGVSVAMSNNPDIKYIQNTSSQLKSTTTILLNATSRLKSKFAAYNLVCKHND